VHNRVSERERQGGEGREGDRRVPTSGDSNLGTFVIIHRIAFRAMLIHPIVIVLVSLLLPVKPL
jgi:hypothetical protein